MPQAVIVCCGRRRGDALRSHLRAPTGGLYGAFTTNCNSIIWRNPTLGIGPITFSWNRPTYTWYVADASSVHQTSLLHLRRHKWWTMHAAAVAVLLRAIFSILFYFSFIFLLLCLSLQLSFFFLLSPQRPLVIDVVFFRFSFSCSFYLILYFFPHNFYFSSLPRDSMWFSFLILFLLLLNLTLIFIFLCIYDAFFLFPFGCFFSFW